VDGKLHEMYIRCCSYYNDQVYCNGYTVAQRIELGGIIRINN